jgi:putative ABC transport system permease protein
MLSDFKFALRMLVKAPGFTAVAVLTLALGIGANTAIFSVVNAVLLKPLPFPDPDQLVAFGGHDKRDSIQIGPLNTLSFPEFFELRVRNQSFTQLAAYRDKGFAFSSGMEVQNLRGQRVTGNFFTTLGIEPALGRVFRLEDEQAGGGPGGLKVVLSNEFWRLQLNGDPSVLGRQITLDRQPFTIIGVMPAGFQYPIQAEANDIYVSTAIDAVSAGGRPPNTEQWDNRQLRCIGRLRPGVSVEQASAEMHTLAGALEKEHSDTNTDWDVIVRPLRDYLVRNVNTALWVLAGAVVCVLLIASVNVANLLLARASSRVREMAVRLAIGAGRGRIIRQLLTESLLLAAIGGAFGLLIAVWGTHGLIALVPKEIPRGADIQLDTAVLIFTLAISFATGIIFGFAPAFQATRIDLNSSLKVSARGSTAGSRRSPLGHALVIVEVALALILLVSAGLLLKSFARLGRVQPGLQTAQLLTARVTLPDIVYPRPQNIARFYEQLVARLRACPGVRAASVTFPLPMSGSLTMTHFDLAEHPLPENQQPASFTRVTGADYFQTMGIPLVRGRFFVDADRLESKQVVIINERFAQRYFHGQDPVGKQMKPLWRVGDQPPQMREIVGVVGNAKHLSLQEDFAPEMYLPIAQVPCPSATIVLRTETTSPATMANTLRAELAHVDPNLPLTAVRVFDEYRAGSLAAPRFNALLLSIFGGVALILTSVGIYGVIAYSVSQRTGEIGIRMALGALPSSIFRLVVGQGMTLIVISIGIGLIGAVACTRVMRSLLFGVTPWDPITFVSIAALIAAVAFLACWLPARRAARIDPIQALRTE